MREMSASKTPWISEYPVDWKQIPLHALFEEHKNKNRNGEEQNLLSLSYGKIIRKDINTNEGLLPESFNGYNVIDEGDIVLRLTDLQNDHRSLRTGLVTERGIITSAYVTLRKKIPLSSEYYHYLLHSFDIMKVFYSMGEGIRQSLDYDELAYCILPYPSLAEQQAIVRYLDAKCSAIDEVTERHKRVIMKLEEYRTKVVTSEILGLHHNDVIETGMDWMSRMSASRKAWRLKYLVKDPLKYGANESGAPYNETQPRYIRITDITPEGGLKDTGKLSLTEEQASKYILEDGTILFARSGATVGKTFLYRETHGRSAFAGYLISVVPNTKIMIPEWLKYYTESLPYKNWKDMIFTQATIQNIGADKYSELIVPICSIDEQILVVSNLDEISSRITRMIETQSSIIAKLEEYRKSIIYNAVTGKIDCREAVK